METINLDIQCDTEKDISNIRKLKRAHKPINIMGVGSFDIVRIINIRYQPLTEDYKVNCELKRRLN
jgi:hypothetical protein